jgi:hypothetical protein
MGSEEIWREIAKAGYEAYAESVGNKNVRGEEMPAWDDQPESIVNAWVAAAQRMCEKFLIWCDGGAGGLGQDNNSL